MQSIWFIILLFFLILFIIPIFAKAYISFDILKNLGTVLMYILFFKIISYKIRFQKGQIVVYTSKDKQEVELKVSDKQLRFIKQMSVQLKEKIILKNVIMYSRIGAGDASNTALATGLFNALVSCFMGYVKNTKKTAKMQIINNPNYNGYDLTISAKVCCFITIFDVLYALIMSFVIIKRSEKYERV